MLRVKQWVGVTACVVITWVWSQHICDPLVPDLWSENSRGGKHHMINKSSSCYLQRVHIGNLQQTNRAADSTAAGAAGWRDPPCSLMLTSKLWTLVLLEMPQSLCSSPVCRCGNITLWSGSFHANLETTHKLQSDLISSATDMNEHLTLCDSTSLQSYTWHQT